MLHLLAYDASITQAVETDLAPVSDSIFTIQNGHFVPQRDIYILWAMAMGATITRARLLSPSIRQITTPFIRPVEANATPGSLYGYQDFGNNPLLARAFEELQVNALQSSAGAEREIVLLGISDSPTTADPVGQGFVMRGTSATAAVANAWTQIAMTWNDTLPAGSYEIIGIEYVAATGVASRVIFEDSPWRPGAPGVAAAASKSWPKFSFGGFGPYGRFNANRFPNIEVLNTAAVASHEIFLTFRRVGG